MSTNVGDGADGSEFALRGPCVTCGFTPDEISPAAAVEALQALPSLWRTTLAVHLDDPDPEGVLTGRPSALDWSALEHAGHVRDVVHALDIRLQRVLREDEPTLPETHVTPPAGANEQGAPVILAALTVSTDQLSGTIEATPDEAWSRSGRRQGERVSARDLVLEAVHEGTHHLRLATRTLADLRATAPAVG